MEGGAEVKGIVTFAIAQSHLEINNHTLTDTQGLKLPLAVTRGHKMEIYNHKKKGVGTLKIKPLFPGE